MERRMVPRTGKENPGKVGSEHDYNFPPSQALSPPSHPSPLLTSLHHASPPPSLSSILLEPSAVVSISCASPKHMAASRQ